MYKSIRISLRTIHIIKHRKIFIYTQISSKNFIRISSLCGYSVSKDTVYLHINNNVLLEVFIFKRLFI
jgi:hypothetical protein